MKGYTTVVKIENYLLTSVAPYFHAQVEEWIGVSELYIDKITGKNFIADTVASKKLYDGLSVSQTFPTQSSLDLQIDDCVSVTALIIDDDTIDTDDYVMYPANSLPKTRIRLLEDAGNTFECGEQEVEVTAKWGYSVAVPSDIEFATTVLTAGIINYSLSAQGEVKAESIGSYSVTYKDEKQWQDLDKAKEIIQMYQLII
jgi:hypothetical protein